MRLRVSLSRYHLCCRTTCRRRSLILASSLAGKFSLQGAAYDLVMSQQDGDPIAKAIWHNRAPIKVRIFAWLLFRDRLNSSANLAVKNVINTTNCSRRTSDFEDMEHIFICCPLAARIWRQLGIDPGHSIQGLWDCCTSNGLDRYVWPFVMFAILWKIWDVRNGMAFRGEATSCNMSIRNIVDDIDL